MERLNKYLAHAGVGSRRHCDTLIAAGRVKVNGAKVTDLGLKIDPEAHKVSVDDSPVRVEKSVYWVVNKPVGYLSTNSDPDGRPRAVDLLPHVDQRVYTVGRLDEASEGLLLMTNDGDLAFHLMHPKYGIPKTYVVLVAGKPTTTDIQKLLDGVWLSDGKVSAQSVRRMKPQGNSTWLRVVLTEGKNREIRRMLAQLGHKVMRLRRVAIGPVTLDKLPKGKARKVGVDELAELRKWVASSKAKIARAEAQAAGPDAPEVAAAPRPPRKFAGAKPTAPGKFAGPKPSFAAQPAGARPTVPGKSTGAKPFVPGKFAGATPAAVAPAGRPKSAFPAKLGGAKPFAPGKPAGAKPGYSPKPVGGKPRPVGSRPERAGAGKAPRGPRTAR